jgi:hypothetical protein
VTLSATFWFPTHGMVHAARHRRRPGRACPGESDRQVTRRETLW